MLQDVPPKIFNPSIFVRRLFHPDILQAWENAVLAYGPDSDAWLNLWALWDAHIKGVRGSHSCRQYSLSFWTYLWTFFEKVACPQMCSLFLFSLDFFLVDKDRAKMLKACVEGPWFFRMVSRSQLSPVNLHPGNCGNFWRMVIWILKKRSACPSFAVALNLQQLPGDYQSEDFEDMLVEMQSDDVVGFGRSWSWFQGLRFHVSAPVMGWKKPRSKGGDVKGDQEYGSAFAGPKRESNMINMSLPRTGFLIHQTTTRCSNHHESIDQLKSSSSAFRLSATWRFLAGKVSRFAIDGIAWSKRHAHTLESDTAALVCQWRHAFPAIVPMLPSNFG